MKILLAILILLMALLNIYKRYFPVLGISAIHFDPVALDNSIIIDLRDYSQSHKEPIKDAINIPIAYLNRNIQEIPRSDLYIVASSPLEKNVGIRLLRKKGFHVVGYSIYDSNKTSPDGDSSKIIKICG
jgi:rhodanese-related sulfurtransferase